MKALQAEVQAKHDDEAARAEAQEREIQMRLEMEQKLEMEKLKAQREEAERAERIRKEEALIKQRQLEFSALEQKLGTVLPLVNEANLIATELKRDMKFNTKMVRVMPEFGSLADSRTEIMIKVDNNEDKYFYQWTADKLENRIEMMREQLNSFFDTNEYPDIDDKDKDPFWDPPEPLLVGTSYLSLKNLGYMMDNELKAKILSSEGTEGQRGELTIKYWPCNAAGEDLDENNDADMELMVDDPKDLCGKEINFRVEIEKAEGLPSTLCKNTFVTYQFKHEPGVIYQTPECDDGSNPVFDYKKVHNVDMMTDYILEYFENGNIPFKVYAYPDFMVRKKTM